MQVEKYQSYPWEGKTKLLTVVKTSVILFTNTTKRYIWSLKKNTFFPFRALPKCEVTSCWGCSNMAAHTTNPPPVFLHGYQWLCAKMKAVYKPEDNRSHLTGWWYIEGWRLELLCWDPRGERWPPHCKLAGNRLIHSRIHGWSGCLCCSWAGSHYLQSPREGSKSPASVVWSHLALSRFRLCCLEEGGVKRRSFAINWEEIFKNRLCAHRLKESSKHEQKRPEVVETVLIPWSTQVRRFSDQRRRKYSTRHQSDNPWSYVTSLEVLRYGGMRRQIKLFNVW